MLVVDAVIVVIILSKLTSVTWFLDDLSKSKCRGRLFWICVSACLFSVCAAGILRLYGAVYQGFYLQKLNKKCLKVIDGRLTQTPFTEECMRPFEYAFIVTNFLPFILTIILLLILYFWPE